MFTNLGEGLSIFLSWEVFGVVLFGAIVGFVVSVLPGISSVNAMALLLPITFAMNEFQALAFLCAIMAAGGFAGSVTSILINVPGDGTNAATTLDGYPMSRKGLAGQALGASATASALGALFGVVILVLMLPVMRSVILAFGPPEMFAISFTAVALIAAVSRGDSVRGLVSGLFGMAIALMGLSVATGVYRFAFGFPVLYEGVPIIPAVIGLFAIPELYVLLRSDEPISRKGQPVKGGVREGIMAVLHRPRALLRGSAIGTLIGIIPGVGGSVAPWVAYYAEKGASKEPEKFGTGVIEGVIAPEASNDAKEGGSLFPLLTLGIPGSLSTAILLTAFLIHGIAPGQRMLTQGMPLVWVILCAVLFTNIATSVVGVAISGALVRMTAVPPTLLAPAVLSLALLGGYADVLSFHGVVFTLIFGFIGVVMMKAGYARPPFIVGFIMLPILERNFHQSIQIYRGSYGFLLRPITLAVLALTVVAVASPYVVRATKRRRHAAAASGAGLRPGSQAAQLGVSPATRAPDSLKGALASSDASDDDATDELPEGARGRIIEIAFPMFVLAVTVVFFIVNLSYGGLTAVFPRVVFFLLGPLALLMVIRSSLRWWRIRLEPLRQEEVVRSDQLIAAWVLALPLLLWLVGFYPAIVVYIIAMRLGLSSPNTRRAHLPDALLASGVVLATVYLIFSQLLDIRLPTGLFS